MLANFSIPRHHQLPSSSLYKSLYRHRRHRSRQFSIKDRTCLLFVALKPRRGRIRYTCVCSSWSNTNGPLPPKTLLVLSKPNGRTQRPPCNPMNFTGIVKPNGRTQRPPLTQRCPYFFTDTSCGPTPCNPTGPSKIRLRRHLPNGRPNGRRIKIPNGQTQ